jgi:hypothetical protein
MTQPRLAVLLLAAVTCGCSEASVPQDPKRRYYLGE